ncbi:MAG: lysophospholipid acyltransferase family protein [Candidatus Kapabacteria bacterium]|nr:lysophospholipid acyltransferase family protein [Candidatus Kapabacteria bacterium]
MSLTDRLTTGVLQAMGGICRRLSWKQRHALGVRLGRIMRGISPKRVGITAGNIAMAYPELPQVRQREILNESYENLGIVLAELLATPSVSRADIEAHFEIRGIEPIVERHRAGLPSILLSAHYGNWELGAMAAGISLGAPVNIVYHPQSNAVADKILNSYRTKFGNVLIPMGSAARAMVKLLSGGGTIGIIVDQHGVPEKDPWIRFMGRPTPTYEAPAALALRFNAPIYFSCCDRRDDGRYIVEFSEVPMSDLDNSRQGVIELTKRHVRMLEDVIRRRPGQWAWQHRRWRSDPPPGVVVVE